MKNLKNEEGVKRFEVNWVDEVHRSVEIEAESKEQAYFLWSMGAWKTEDMGETDCNTLSEKNEIMSEIYEV